MFRAARALTRFLFRAQTFGALLILPLTHAQSVPRIVTNGIVNNAGAPPPPAPVAPGSIISIYGSNFNSSPGTHAGGVSATTSPLPTSINGTQVLINSLFAPLYYVDSSQINAQVPWEVSGASYLTVQVIVNGLPSNLATVALAPNAPGLLLVTHASTLRLRRHACRFCFSRPRSGAMPGAWESAIAITTKKKASSAACWTGCEQSPRMGSGLARCWLRR